jgi:hypothetical protein
MIASLICSLDAAFKSKLSLTAFVIASVSLESTPKLATALRV